MAQNRTIQKDLTGSLGLALSHPLYYLLTISFQALPFHESAFKTNLVSAVFGAITVANLALLVRLVTGRWRGAIVGACSLSVAHTFWQHCALAEVYTVTTALLVLELICLHQYLLTRRALWLCLLFFANGLGISNHMFASLSLICYVVVIGVMLLRRQLSIKLLPILLLVWVAGASVYLALILRQLAHGAELLPTIHSALFGDFSRNVLNLVPSRRQLVNTVLYLGLNFPTPAVFLAFLGLWRWRTVKPHDQWGGVLLAVSVIHLVWAARYNVPDQYTFFIPFIVLLCIWIGLGADTFLNRYSNSLPWLVLASLLPAAVYVPLPRLAQRLHLPLGFSRELPYRKEYEYFLQPWKTGYRGAERFALEVRDTLPAGCVVLCDTTTVEPIHYLQETGRWRPGVAVYPPLAQSEVLSAVLDRQKMDAKVFEGRAFVVSPIRTYCPGWVLTSYRFERFGPVFRILPAATVSTTPTTAP